MDGSSDLQTQYAIYVSLNIKTGVDWVWRISFSTSKPLSFEPK